MAKKVSGTDQVQQKQGVFIAEYLRNGHKIDAACKKAKVSRPTFYRWKKDKDFCARLEERAEAKSEAEESFYKRIDGLADGAIERGLKMGDTDLAVKVKAALHPERWDAGCRKALFEKQRSEDAPRLPRKLILKRGGEPPRLIGEDAKTGTDEK